MKHQWGVNRLTGAQAVEELRKAGLVVTRPGVGSFIAATPELRVVDLLPGDTVTARMPTEEERKTLGTTFLTPVLIVTRSGGGVEPTTPPSLSADRTSDGGAVGDRIAGRGGFGGHSVQVVHVALAAQQ
jgi:hypothetical protein